MLRSKSKISEISHAIENEQWDTASFMLNTPEATLVTDSWFQKKSVFTGNILLIHLACSIGRVDNGFLQQLLRKNPDSIQKKETGYGRLPLHVAIRAKAPDSIILYLLNEFPKAASVQDAMGRVPLHYACSNKASQSVIVSLIQACPSSLYANDNAGGWTPLHVAVNIGAGEMAIRTIIETAPDTVLLKTSKGNTPKQCCRDSNIVNILEAAEIKFDSKPEFRNISSAEEQEQLYPSRQLTDLSKPITILKTKRNESFRHVS